MLFNSFQFLIFFPAVILIYAIVPKRIRYIWLLIASYCFYMFWNAKYGLLLLFVTAITWFCGILLDAIDQKGWDEDKGIRWKKWCIAGVFTANLSLLLFFKYINFLIDNINFVLDKAHLRVLSPGLNIVLPVGISFYIFQALGYTMDVYRRNVSAEKNFLKYALFVAFFPQMLSGPIGRSTSILGQIRRLEELEIWNYERITRGVHLILWGFFQKLVIADRIAIVVNQVYGSYQEYGFVELFTAMVLFAFQIYSDLGGYSNIARGVAQIMGIELIDNFHQPYLAKNIKSFWRRWHISLTSWLTDYLYIPLGGNRKGKIRQYFNIMVVFLCSGLWHGASWTYVIWGAIHGIFQVAGNWKAQISRNRGESAKEHWILGMWKIGFTFVLVSFAWIFFRADTISQAWGIIGQMFRHRRLHSFTDMGLDYVNWLVLIFALILLILVDCLHESGKKIRESLYKKNAGIRLCVYVFGLWAVIMFGVYGLQYDVSNFIYSQF